jgi:hypothetical protein
MVPITNRAMTTTAGINTGTSTVDVEECAVDVALLVSSLIKLSSDR